MEVEYYATLFFTVNLARAKDRKRVRMHTTTKNHDDDKRRRVNQVITMTVDQKRFSIRSRAQVRLIYCSQELRF